MFAVLRMLCWQRQQHHVLEASMLLLLLLLIPTTLSNYAPPTYLQQQSPPVYPGIRHGILQAVGTNFTTFLKQLFIFFISPFKIIVEKEHSTRNKNDEP
jgi:hypothetical protein